MRLIRWLLQMVRGQPEEHAQTEALARVEPEGSEGSELANAAQARWYARYRNLFDRQQRIRARMQAIETRTHIRGRRVPTLTEVVENERATDRADHGADDDLDGAG